MCHETQASTSWWELPTREDNGLFYVDQTDVVKPGVTQDPRGKFQRTFACIFSGEGIYSLNDFQNIYHLAFFLLLPSNAHPSYTCPQLEYGGVQA